MLEQDKAPSGEGEVDERKNLKSIRSAAEHQDETLTGGFTDEPAAGFITPADHHDSLTAGDGAPSDDRATDHELSRRERERLMRRQLMLDAARSVFAEKGYAEATLDEVAARAEFGKGTLYNYFEGGKEEILFAIFDDLFDALCRLVDATFSPELVRSSPFRTVFEGFLTAIFAFFLDRQDQFMILMKEGHRMTFNEQPEKSSYFQEQGERIIHVLIAGITAAQAKGDLRDFPPSAIAHMIMGNIKGYHMHMCLRSCQTMLDRMHREDGTIPSAEESAKFLTTFLLDGILCQSPKEL
jgi:AcrR family transcriptional regulator